MESTDEKEERKISSTIFVRLMCKNYLEESFLATHQYKAKLNDTKSQFINFSSSKRNWCGNQYVFRARNSNLFSVQLNSSFQKIFLSIFFFHFSKETSITLDEFNKIILYKTCFIIARIQPLIPKSSK